MIKCNNENRSCHTQYCKYALYALVYLLSPCVLCVHELNLNSIQTSEDIHLVSFVFHGTVCLAYSTAKAKVIELF